MCEEIVHRLTQAGLPYAAFGSAVGALYGWTRAPADIDLVVDCDDLAPLRRWFPAGVAMADNGWRLGAVELWHAPLKLCSDGRERRLDFDDELRRRRVRHPIFGWVLAPEDQVVVKAALRRSRDGKADLDDARALLRRWAAHLDLAYLGWRGALCGVTDVVAALLAEIGR